MAFFSSPRQEDDAAERMRLAKMLRQPGLEMGWIVISCLHFFTSSLASNMWISHFGETRPICLVREDPFVKCKMNCSQSNAFRLNINESINVQKGWRIQRIQE